MINDHTIYFALNKSLVSVYMFSVPARSFANSEVSRYSQSSPNVVPPTSTTTGNTPTTSTGDSRNTNSHNHNNFTPNNVLPSAEHHHHRKPPVLQHPPQPEPHPAPMNNISRKMPRG